MAYGESPIMSAPRNDVRSSSPNAAQGGAVHLEPGRTLYLEGDTVRSLYRVESGVVLLVRTAADGRRLILDIIGSGEFVDLATEGERDHAAEAAGPVQLTSWTVGGLAKDAGLMSALNQEGLRRVKRSHDHLMMLGSFKAPERLAAFLLFFAERQKAAIRGGQIRCKFPLTRQQVADFTGMTLETVSRTLCGWKRAGLIAEAPRNELIIRQPGKLRQLAGFEDADSFGERDEWRSSCAAAA